MTNQSNARTAQGAGLLIALLAAFATVSAQAADSGIWRWTDAQGNQHYSDQPLNANAVDIHARSPKKFNPDTPSQSPLEKKAQADRDAQAASAAAAASAPAPASAVVALTRTASDDAKRACDQSAAAVQQLSQGGRISSVDASGQRSVLTDDQIAGRLREAKAAQARWCSSAPSQ